jgi:hypothetical protein
VIAHFIALLIAQKKLYVTCTLSSLHSKTTIPKDHYFTYKKQPKYHCTRIGNNRCVIIYMTIGIFIFSVGFSSQYWNRMVVGWEGDGDKLNYQLQN